MGTKKIQSTKWGLVSVKTTKVYIFDEFAFSDSFGTYTVDVDTFPNACILLQQDLNEGKAFRKVK